MPVKNRDDDRVNAIKKRVAQRMADLPAEEAPKPVFQRYIDPINFEAIMSAANRTRLKPSTPPPTPIPSLVLDEGSADINLSNSFYASTEDISSPSSPLFFTSSEAQAMSEVNLPHQVHFTQEIGATRKKTLTSTRDTQQQPLAQGSATNTLKLLRMIRNSPASKEDAKTLHMGTSIFSPLQQRPLAQGSKANILKPVTMKHNSPLSKEDAEISAITGHFSGPAISLRQRNRRPLALSPTSIKIETTSFDDSFEPEDAGMATTSAHFAGPAISLRQRDRRPPSLNLTSINTEAGFFRNASEPKAPRAPHKETSVLFPSY